MKDTSQRTKLDIVAVFFIGYKQKSGDSWIKNCISTMIKIPLHAVTELTLVKLDGIGHIVPVRTKYIEILGDMVC